MIPNFLIIGAARCGTTSIYHHLCEHPDIFMPVEKEPSFFSMYWDQGLSWYEAIFNSCAGQKAIGEASTSYTSPLYTGVPNRIVSVLPDVRLIYIIRDPVDRAFSHYLYARSYGAREPLEFNEAIKSNPVYLDSGLYYSWVEQYLSCFEKTQLQVYLFEDFVEHPAEFIRQIFAYLNVADDFVPSNLGVRTNQSFRLRSLFLMKQYRRFSVSKLRFRLERFIPQKLRPIIRNQVRGILGSDKNMPSLRADTRKMLMGYYYTDANKLSEFLGRDLVKYWDLA